MRLRPGTTYWFSLLPPDAQVSLPAGASAANGIVLGGVYDPSKTLVAYTDDILVRA